MSGWTVLLKGDVVTIQNRNGDYITACEDKKTVALEKELRLEAGSNNPQYWALVDTGLGIQTLYVYHLKSIYGTFLSVDTEGDRQKVCQRLSPAQDNIKRDHHPWVLNCSTCYSMAPPNWFYLQYTHATAVRIDDDGNLVLGTVSELKKGEAWHIQVVDSGEKAILQNNKEQQNNETWPPTPLNAPPYCNAHSSVTVQLPIVTDHDYGCSLTSGKNKVVINFNNQMTAGGGGEAGPSSVCTTGKNINISGTQETGDVNIQYQAGRYDGLYFEFKLA